MLDVQADIERLSHSQRNSYMSQYQTDAAFCDLALWSNPAWLNTARCLLSTAAATQWVLYHRTSIDQKKVTVSQLMGSVRGVIPNSKLAKYGDYRYNMDYEDMYRMTEDMTVEWDKSNESFSSRRHFHSNISNQDINNSVIQHEENELKLTKRWLKKVKNALDAVRIITNEEQLSDSNPIALLKLCLRFIYAASINVSLIDTMKSEITFIIDYEQHRKIPISMLELQSIPQPRGQTNCTPNNTIDTLWLKLASKEIRQLWKDGAETSPPFNATDAFDNPLTPLMKINFLRRRHQTNKGLEEQNLNIPKIVQVELLGSLLDVLEETSIPSNRIPNNEGDTQSNLPAAHGTCSKRLPLTPKELDQLLEKEAFPQSGTITGNVINTLKGEHKTLTPRTFYKYFPPPNLAPGMRVPTPTLQPPSNMYFQNRSNNVMMPANIPNLQHTKSPPVHFMVPKLPVTYLPSSKYVPSHAPPPIWNNYFLQRLNASIQATTSGQYSRMTAPPLFNQHHSLKGVTEVQKPETNEKNFASENASQQKNEVVGNKVPNDKNHWPMYKSVVQPTNYEFNSSTRIYQNRGCTFRNWNIPQPISHNRYLQPVSSKICGVNSTYQLPVHESVIQTKSLRPLIEHRLPQFMHRAVPRSQIMPQIALKPTMETYNGMKQVQEKLVLERNNHDAMNEQLHQPNSIYHKNRLLNGKAGDLSYEDKVENWLHTVNKHMKSGSCLNSKDLSETCQLEITGDNKFHSHKREDNEKLGVNQNILSTDVFQSEPNEEKPFQFHNLGANKKHAKKNKIGNDRELLMKHLQLCGKYGIQLKKGKNLESKIKILKKFFAEIDLEKNYPVNLNCKIKNLKLRKQMLKNKIVSPPRRQIKSELKQKVCHELRIKSKTPQFTSESYFDLQKKVFLNDASNYKVLIRESYVYNAFPSKRMNITNSKFSFADDEFRLQKERDKIASLIHLEKVIDELFFADGQVGNTNELSENQSVELETINGWAHFKITVKSVLKDIISSLQKQKFSKMNVNVYE